MFDQPATMRAFLTSVMASTDEAADRQSALREERQSLLRVMKAWECGGTQGGIFAGYADDALRMPVLAGLPRRRAVTTIRTDVSSMQQAQS